MKNLILSLVILLLIPLCGLAQMQNYEGGVQYKQRRTSNKIELTPGTNSDLKFSSATGNVTMRYGSNSLIFLGGTNEIFRATTSAITLNDIYIAGGESVGQLYRSADTIMALAADSTWYNITGLTAYENAIQTTLTDSTIEVNWPGYYSIHYNGDIAHSADTVKVNIGVFVNDTVEQVQIIGNTNIKAKDKHETIIGSGLVLLNPGDVVSLKAKATKTGNLTISGINFYIKRE